MKPDNPFSINTNHTTNHPEISRMLSAAVINSRFRELLLQKPLAAIRGGYLGEMFSLDPTEQQAIAAIKADTLSEFAAQLTNL